MVRANAAQYAQIELEALRPCGLPVGQREFVAEVAWDLPSLAPGATSLLNVAVPGWPS